MNTKIEEMLAEIGERVESLDSDVNSGGCGIYAYELLKRLSKNGIDGKIVVYHSTWDTPTDWNITNVENNLRKRRIGISNMFNWYDNFNVTGFAHIKVEVDNKVFDSEESVDIEESNIWNTFYKRMEGYLSLDALAKINRMRSNWNPTFDRKFVPKIRKIMDQTFQKYGLSV